MKKSLCTLLILLFVFSSVFAQGSPESKGTTEVKKERVIVEAAPGERHEVLMWSAVSGTIGNILQAAADSFNAAQDRYFINIQYQGDYTAIYTKLTTTINPNDLPDMAIVSTELVGTYSLTKDLLRPLSYYWDANYESWKKLNGNLKAVWGDGSGNPSCYPYGNSFYGQFVNEDMFKAAGIDPYTALTSVEGLYKAAKALKDGGFCEVPVALDSWGGFVWYALAAAGTPFLNNDNGRSAIPTEVLIDTPKVKQALYDYFYYFRKMQQEGLMVDYGSSWGDVCLPSFATQKSAVCTGSIAAFQRIEKAYAEKPFKLGWLPAFAATNVGIPKGYAASGTGFCIVESGDEKGMTGASKFIEWTSKVDTQIALCTGTGYLPISEEVLNAPQYQDFVKTRFPGALKAFRYQQEAVVDALHTNALNPINNACQSESAKAWSQVMTDFNIDINAVIDTMDATLQDALDLWLLTNT